MLIIVYGADWCEDTQRSMRHLRRLGLPYRYINIDEDLDALDRAKALNSGRRRTPVIDIGGAALVEPTNDALTAALVDRQHLSVEEVQERTRAQNVGDLERALRAGGGIFLVALAAVAPRALRWPLRLAGAAIALSGFAGWHPEYSVTRRSSLDGPGDRPAKARRSRWTVRRLTLGEAAR
jgi:mycoredoxin